MAGRYAGKTIVVTGSGKQKGLGQAILQRFADKEANRLISDLTSDAEAAKLPAGEIFGHVLDRLKLG